MRTFRILLLVVATLLMGVMATQAQVFTQEKNVKTSAGKAYFQLKNSQGDSTQTLGNNSYTAGSGGIGDIGLAYTTAGGQVLYMLPDSIKIRYYSTNDSVINVNIGVRTHYATAQDTGLWTLIGVDTATTPSGELQRRGVLTVTKSTFQNAVRGGFDISIKANSSGNCTGNAAAGTANAAKLYITLEEFFTKP